MTELSGEDQYPLYPQAPTPAHDLEELIASVSTDELAETRQELLDAIVEDKKRVTERTGVTEDDPTAFQAALNEIGSALLQLRQEIVVDDDAVALYAVVRRSHARHLENPETVENDEI
jgi:hypothetical protein